MFAREHEGVAPDIMTLAKGLGSGLPIGAVVAKKSLMQQWKRGAHGNTYGGNPISCAAANATIDLVREQYCANAAKVGAHFMKRLHELKADYPCIGDVRGRGLMIGMELIEQGRHRPRARWWTGCCTARTTTACCCSPAAVARCASCRRCA